VPVSAPAREGAASADAPGADLSPAHSPAEALALVVMLALPCASLSPALRVFSSRSPVELARRWREPQASALETVEKVATTSGLQVRATTRHT
jgi:hypothetical protein